MADVRVDDYLVDQQEDGDAQVPLSTQGAPREAQDETGKETVVEETGAPAPARTPELLAAPEEQGVAQKKPKNAKAAPKAGAAAKKAKAPAAKAKKAPVKKAAAKTTVKKTASFKQSKPAASPAVAPGTKASTTQRLAAYTLPPLTFKTGASERNARAKAHRRGRV